MLSWDTFLLRGSLTLSAKNLQSQAPITTFPLMFNSMHF